MTTPPRFNKRIPNRNKNINVAQPELLQNNIALNDIFGVDHYKFTDVTANIGKHNQMTFPPSTVGIPNTVDDCKTYAFQPTELFNLLTYSKGPENTVSSPITFVQGADTFLKVGKGKTKDIYDFQSLTRAQAIFYCVDYGDNTTSPRFFSEIMISWSGKNFLLARVGTNEVLFDGTIESDSLIGAYNGSVFQVQNVSTSAIASIFWTLKFLRVEKL